MPNLPRPDRKKYLPKQRTDRKPTSDQAFYNKAVWAKARLYYRTENPLCEVSAEAGQVVPGEVVDHIIPISNGGARLDPKNLMTLSAKIHDIKSGMESKASPLIGWDYNDNGDKIPIDRSLIIQKLIKFVK